MMRIPHTKFIEAGMIMLFFLTLLMLTPLFHSPLLTLMVLLCLSAIVYVFRDRLLKSNPRENLIASVSREDEDGLSPREKHLLLFHLLSLLRGLDTLDLNNVARETTFTIKTLNSMAEWMENQGIATLNYPPQTGLPVIIKTDSLRLEGMTAKVLGTLVSKDLAGKPVTSEFKVELVSFIREHRR
jgi:hypothetical protein